MGIITRLLMTGIVGLVLLAAACATAPVAQTAEEAPATEPAPTVEEEPETQTTPAPPSVCAGEDLSTQEAYELLGGAALPLASVTAIDTRGPEYYTAGHIPGAILISTVMPDFWEKMRELPRDGTYLVYCHRGSISSRVVEQMIEQEGFTRACNMSGGFNRWKSEGLPIEEGDG